MVSDLAGVWTVCGLHGWSGAVKGSRTMVLVGLLAAAGLVVAACSSGASEPVPAGSGGSARASATRPAASPSPKPSSTFRSTGDPINDAYVQFWLGFMNAQSWAQPNYPSLVNHATGQALAWAQETIRADSTYGWVRDVQSGYGVNSHVTRRSAETAQVTDAQDWTLWPLVVDKTGQIVSGSTGRRCITAGLSRRNGGWRVNTIVVAQGGC